MLSPYEKPRSSSRDLQGDFYEGEFMIGGIVCGGVEAYFSAILVGDPLRYIAVPAALWKTSL